MATFTVPKTIGACADKLYRTRQARLKLDKEVAELKRQESALKDHIIKTLPKSRTTGVAGKLGRVKVITEEIPRVEDWDKFYDYVRRTKSFELLQRRVSNTAVTDRWENKKEVPGVGRFNNVKVSITKVS